MLIKHNPPRKHEYLLKDNSSGSRIVKKGRLDKICEHCNKIIPIGTSHLVYSFYPDFHNYAIHESCSLLFENSLN